ncbi:MAG: alpha/beta fold hydrolase [Chloroflexota bacterium]
MSEGLSVFPSPEGQSQVLAAYDRVLAQWPVPYTELDIATSLGTTHVIASGPEAAPPIVFLHAYAATATVWYPNAGPLSRHYRTFAVDVIGEANKSRPTRPTAKLEDYLQWFVELLDGLGVQQTHLVGNSFGAFLSTYFAMQLPERIRRLVLIGPAATFRQIVPFYIHMFAPKLLTMLFPNIPGGRGLIRHSVNWIRNGLPLDPLWEDLFYQALLHGGGTNRVFPKVYSRQALSQMTTPTLLLIGDRERIYRPEDAIRIAERSVPNLQTEIVPNAHHITALAQPAIVNARIERFFGEDRKASGPLVGARAPVVRVGPVA